MTLDSDSFRSVLGRFASGITVVTTRDENGAVLLDDALAHIECNVVGRHAAGDHMIFIGEVERAVAQNGRPLLYYRGGYAQLER